MITTISLLTICHHTKISHNYWLCSPHCFIWVIHLFCNLNCVHSISLTLFLSSPHTFPPGNLFALCICVSVSVLLYLVICFLNFTYKSNHAVFVFVWFISLCRIFSKAIHVVTNGKISFFVYFILLIYVYTTSSYTIIYWWALRLLPIAWQLQIMLQWT